MRLAPAFSPAASADVWHDFTFNGSWHDQDVPTWGKAQYTKDVTGCVCFRGQVASFGGNGIIMYLPEGYRPSRDMTFVVPLDGSTWWMTIEAATGAMNTHSGNACTNATLNHIRFDPR